jgi:hypothetical protein
MIDERHGGSGCVVMSDGRFAVLGGNFIPTGDSSDDSSDGIHDEVLASCEALVLCDEDNHSDAWEPLPLMLEEYAEFVCASIQGYIIVADQYCGAETYEEASGRWWRLPCDFPDTFCARASAVL